MIKKLLGGIILLSVLGTFFAMQAMKSGILVALFVRTIAIAVTVAVAIGVWLLIDG